MKINFKLIQYNSPVILTFTLVAFIVLLLGILSGGTTTSKIFTNYGTSIFDPMQILRMILYVFGHSNWEHFSSNFLLILLIGPMLEEKHGSKSLAIMILITTIFTGLIHIIFFDSGILGASGVVFMMILLSSFANAESGKIPLTLLIVVAIFIGKEIVQGITETDNISQLAHILGGFCGGAFGYFAMEEKKKREKK